MPSSLTSSSPVSQGDITSRCSTAFVYLSTERAFLYLRDSLSKVEAAYGLTGVLGRWTYLDDEHGLGVAPEGVLQEVRQLRVTVGYMMMMMST